MKKFLLIVFIGIILFFAFAYYEVDKYTDSLVPYTQNEAITIPQIQMSNDDLLEKRRTFADFTKTLEDGTCNSEYVLTGEEVNVLIKDVDNVITLTKWVYANIKDSNITVEFSAPLDNVKLPFDKFKGKFVNGNVIGAIKYSSEKPNELQIKIDELKVGEKDVNVNMKDFTKQNLESIFAQNPNMKKIFASIDSINLDNDKLIIKCKNINNVDADNIKNVGEDK